MPTLANIQVV